MRPTGGEKNSNLSARMKTITNVGRLIERLQKANAKTARLGIDQHARNVVVAVKLDDAQALRAQQLEAAELELT